ncbi:MAG: hypothetical protein Q8928_02930 [Bacteroidota bacterium]|nr:hypothetical protein [Bacteroidota bacterium]
MMKRTILLVFIGFYCLVQPVSSQTENHNLKSQFLDAEYFLANEKYLDALYAYNSIYKQGYSDNASINFRIGQCLLHIPGSKSRAIPYLEKAVKKAQKAYVEGSLTETNAPLGSWVLLGDAYRINNQFAKAIAAYQKYKSMVKGTDKRLKFIDQDIASCRIAPKLIKSPVAVTMTNLASNLGYSGKVFNPVVSPDEQLIFFNSAEKFYDAVWCARKQDSTWAKGVNITSELQSNGNQYVSSVSASGNELFLRKEDDMEADLVIAKFENGHWTQSQLLDTTVNSAWKEGNASISSDGKTLYFSSNRKGGFGEMDIYKSERLSNGHWGVAVNLGKSINTGLNEDAPFITNDGKRLYFVSQGHNSMGGFDVFYSDLKPDGTWSKAVNLGFPLNTTDDEMFFCPVKNGSAGYMSKVSKNEEGVEDIFRIEFSVSKILK